MSAPRAEILVVEDDASIRESLAECLELEGHVVRSVANGPEALAWLGAGNLPRVIVLDLVMPLMSGEEVLERIRAAPATRALPVVLMTAASSIRAPQADGLVAKPFELAQLLEAVRPFLEP